MKLRGSNHRVLFQNAEGDINMGFWFNDPRVQLADVFWFHTFGIALQGYLMQNEGLVTFDPEYKTKSCYVELHRNGYRKH